MTEPHFDKSEYLNGFKVGTNRESVETAAVSTGCAPAFQADDEGSIPFTRSTVFRQTANDVSTRTGTSVPAWRSFLTGFLRRIPCWFGLHAPPLHVGGACPACGRPQDAPEGWA